MIVELEQPLPNVTVTIMSGPRSGERTITDINGRYLFPDVAGDTLHLLAERHRFEPKEVLVHRDQPTTLADGTALNYAYVACPQRHPGNIALGQRWPDEVRFILRDTLVVHDLLYIEGGIPPPDSALPWVLCHRVSCYLQQCQLHAPARSRSSARDLRA